MKHKVNKKVLRRTLSLILVITMLVTGLNLDMMSESIYAAQKTESTEDNPKDEVTVVKELANERTENSNTYLMSDGSKRLEIYNGNIRYLQNGKMVDYDSSLTEISKRDRTRLKKIADDTESKQINKYEYVNTQGDTKQYFAESLNDETPIILTKDNYSIRFVPSVDSSSNKIDDNNEQNIKFSGIDNNENKISYENKNKKIDYEYYSLNNGVKEEIVLHEKPSTNIFEFKYELKNLKLVKDKNVNIIDIVDEKTSEEVAYIYAPNIIEQDGIPSYDNIEYNVIANSDGSYSLRIEVNRKYLEQASYPITIDPTLVWRDSSEVLLRETFKCGGATTSVIDSSKTFMISTLSGGYESQVYIKFPNLNDKIRGKKIDFGYANITTSNVSGKPDINVYQVMEDWDYNKVTWDTKPSIGGEKLGKSSGNYVTDTMFTVWMTNWLRKIALGEINDNYGIALYNDNKEPTNLVTSYGFSAEDITKRPLFIIKYIDPIDTGAVYDGSFQISSEYDDNDNTIKLQWDDTIEDIDRYEVYKRVGNSDKFEIIGATIETNYSLEPDGTEETMDIRVMAVKDGVSLNVATDDTNYLSNIVSIAKTESSNEDTNEQTTQYEQTTFDTDGDGLEDGYEIWDFKTLWNTETGIDKEGNKTYDLDTDDDGLPDSYEVFTLGTNPTVANPEMNDSDNDGLPDSEEYDKGTDPWLPNSDFDGVSDSGDSTPRRTNGYTRSHVAYIASVHKGLYDTEYSVTEGDVTVSYITNIYRGETKQIYYDYGDANLNKKIKYFYDANGNNTAIVEQYDSDYVPNDSNTNLTGEDQIICVTYTYDSKNNVTFICDQSTKYNMSYDEEGNISSLDVGTYNLIQNDVTVTTNHSDADSENTYETTYGNGQKVKKVISEYEVTNTNKIAKREEVYFSKTANGGTNVYGTNADYMLEYDEEGQLVNFADYTKSVNNPIQYQYSYTDTGSLVTRNDGFSKAIEVTESKDEDGKITTYTTNTTYSFKSLKGNIENINESLVTNDDNGDSTKTFSYGDIYTSLTSKDNNENNITESKIYSNIFHTDILTSIETEKSNTSRNYRIEAYDSEKSIDYVYDNAGNITRITIDESVAYEYTYDPHGRLVTEKDYVNCKFYRYNYGDSANVHSKNIWDLDTNGNKINSTKQTIYLTYDDGDNAQWPDQLKSYNGQTIIYDGIGNPLSYINGMSFDWSRGRQLDQVTFSDNTTASYTYNQNGLRTHKETKTESVEYTWDDSSLIREVVTLKDTNKTYDVWYLYDENDSAVGFMYYHLVDVESNKYLSLVKYYYEKDLQGNIIGILDAHGYEVVAYSYDAWGNITDTTYTSQLPYQLNHLTYRGYYRDEETGFYYLQSRYYDAEVGRFINADATSYLGASGTVWGYNLYAYCENNPVNYTDPKGNVIWACIIVGALVGAVAGGVYSAYKSKKKLGYVNGYWVLGGTVVGAGVGALAGWGVSAACSALGVGTTAGSSGTLGSTIYASWQNAEQALRNAMNSVSTTAQRTLSTPYGNRIVDAYNKSRKVIGEAKYGYQSLSQSIQKQIEKDAWLLRTGKVKSVEWHFYWSKVSKTGGPSGPLLRELLKRGFKVKFH